VASRSDDQTFRNERRGAKLVPQQLKLMCILAHPDDESLGMGGILARYAAEGVATYLATATRGEHGWQGPAADYPGPAALGRMREAELRAAAHTLGLQEVSFLDYQDGALDRADPAEVISKLVAYIRRVRPQVVVTFDPTGYYGHPDHIAISQHAAAAVVAAADPSYECVDSDWPAQRVAKLYYLVPTAQTIAAYQAAFGDLMMPVDRVKRRAVGWPDWSITTRIDTAACWRQVWQAVSCHRTQLPGYQALANLPEEDHKNLWGRQMFYRTFSLVNGGRALEDDLFAGLR
jgi:LmbE family N-acetylglucosaminyl deacetylase